MSIPNDPNMPSGQPAVSSIPAQQAQQAQTVTTGAFQQAQAPHPAAPASGLVQATDEAHRLYQQARDQIHAHVAHTLTAQPMGNILAAFVSNLLQTLGPVVVQIILQVLQNQAGTGSPANPAPAVAPRPPGQP